MQQLEMPFQQDLITSKQMSYLFNLGFDAPSTFTKKQAHEKIWEIKKQKLKEQIVNLGGKYDEKMRLVDQENLVDCLRTLQKEQRRTTFKEDKNGYLVNLKGEKKHRLVYETTFGCVPYGWAVHHIDENKKNNSPENLIAMPARLHNVLHGLQEKHSRRLKKSEIEELLEMMNRRLTKKKAFLRDEIDYKDAEWFSKVFGVFKMNMTDDESGELK